MTIENQTTLTEVWHDLREDDSEAEVSVLAGIQQHFSEFKGTMREAYDAMIAQTPTADNVELESVDDAGVKGWWIRPESAPADRVLLFLHGGAFMLGSAEAYRAFASQIAVRADVNTFVLDYPLAPEHPFPAAYDAVIVALQWITRPGVREIALVGDSAGGGLALAALGADGGRSLNVACIAAFSPWLDLALTGPSLLSDGTYDPIFQRSVLTNAATTYLGSADPTDGRASPLYSIPDHLPPIAFQVGTNELLLDDARRYATAVAKRGVTVQIDIFEGLHHVFQRSTQELASARYALDQISSFISRCWAIT